MRILNYASADTLMCKTYKVRQSKAQVSHPRAFQRACNIQESGAVKMLLTQSHNQVRNYLIFVIINKNLFHDCTNFFFLGETKHQYSNDTWTSVFHSRFFKLELFHALLSLLNHLPILCFQCHLYIIPLVNV